MENIFYYFISITLIIVDLVFVLMDMIGWGDFISIAILGVTAIAIFMQAFATRVMAEYEIFPMVDVNMVYDNQKRKTYFWFSNTSTLPALVSFQIFNKKEKLHDQSLRIPPQRPTRTSIVYDFDPSEGKEVTLRVSIKPALKNFDTKIDFEKSYRFHEYPEKSDSFRWDETSWGFPDPVWPEK